METKIDSPEHYQDTRLMDYLIDHKIGFAEGNICKYVVRWDKKGGLADLKKAQDYLNALSAKEELRLWTAENDLRVEKAISHMKQDIKNLTEPDNKYQYATYNGGIDPSTLDFKPELTITKQKGLLP